MCRVLCIKREIPVGEYYRLQIEGSVSRKNVRSLVTGIDFYYLPGKATYWDDGGHVTSGEEARNGLNDYMILNGI